MPARLSAPLVAAAILAALPLLVHSQQPPLRDTRPFRTSIELISITATVTDREGHLITGLSGDAFEIYEDGERQGLTQFPRERGPGRCGSSRGRACR